VSAGSATRSPPGGPLQRYLDGEHALTAGDIRALLAGPDPVVLIGTMWPEYYTLYTAIPPPCSPDPQARGRQVPAGRVRPHAAPLDVPAERPMDALPVRVRDLAADHLMPQPVVRGGGQLAGARPLIVVQ